ncbi:PH domain-containing protein [Cobetia crustatorum]|nr:PH domain-containing protein [Cobetia crustatorum]
MIASELWCQGAGLLRWRGMDYASPDTEKIRMSRQRPREGSYSCASEVSPDGSTVESQGNTMIDFNNKGFFKLKQNDEYAERVNDLLIEGEEIISAYKSMRDGVVFTNKRIIAVNVQGLTGSKKDFTSLPYKKIETYSIETSGTFDLDSELTIYFSALGTVRFEFTGKTRLTEISQVITTYVC